ncbi:anti-sigma factor antagonist [Rathayibacter sp. VKM Ac-2759]|uniref:STAS domain-containing protein n=1 Tax=Rathayibacter sp. VKM Ac-2759 TaxID=2609252 RepID=UPI0013176EB7|nr:STAS domain-containing protein [Rathayibacter sp. VKM Ac-2759]QHC68013.1 anti-sigma factor antagonist [Rathayibacter sp. VKM Ac-2759]
MIIRTETDPSRSTVHLVGRFDAHEAATFRRTVEPLITDERPELGLDLSQVAFVDSTALAELVRLHKAAAARGGAVVLTALSDPVRVILEITDLAGVFRIAEQEGAETP